MTLILIFSFIHLILAHNWIHSNSRAIKASTIQPAPPAPAKFTPHLRVGQGENFGFEWATGHSNSEYFFVVTHAKHEDKLSKHTINNLKTYLSEAKSSDLLQGNQWQKRHVSCGFSNMCTNKHKNTGKQYLKQLQPGDELYFERPESWGDSGVAQFQYKQSDLQGDKRASYTNSKWPWIEAVHHFKVAQSFPREWDIANFVIDGKEGPGHYLIHMVWRGYRDVIDVDLLSGPSPDIYGTSAAGDAGHFNKVDHCQFKTYNHKNNQCFFIEPTDRDVSQCLKACKRKLGTKCTGVNVVPLYNPSAVAIDRVNIPWKSTKCDQTMASQYDEGTLVCYGLKYKPAKKGGNPDVGYPWTVVDSDPEDPIFYSTCYTYQKSWSFEGFDSGSAKPQSSVVSYKAGDQCISCRDVDRIKKLKFKEVPWWKLAKECSKCS